MKNISVQIKGVSPLLMHRYPLDTPEAMEKRTAQEQCEVAAYRGADGGLIIPGVNIQRALVSSAAFSKGKGRASLQKIAAAGIFILENEAPLGTKQFAVDSRAVVIAATGGRIVRHRPRLDVWETGFTLSYDERLLTEKQLRTIVDDCGSRVGLLDFRPERKGPFGRFMVTKWETVEG